MKITPKTEKELASENLLEPGIYDVEVMEAKESVSKKGNEMIKLKLRVFSDRGERHIYDYLLDSVSFKVRHFCEAVGLLEIYEAGTLLAIDCFGRAGKAHIAIQKDKTGEYPDRNGVKDYIVDDSTIRITPKASAEMVTSGFDTDDVPF